MIEEKDIKATIGADHYEMMIIAKEVCRTMRINEDVLFDYNGKHPYPQIRQMFMHVCWERGHSYASIGRFIGRDHTTIIHGVNAHKARLIDLERLEENESANELKVEFKRWSLLHADAAA